MPEDIRSSKTHANSGDVNSQSLRPRLSKTIGNSLAECAVHGIDDPQPRSDVPSVSRWFRNITQSARYSRNRAAALCDPSVLAVKSSSGADVRPAIGAVGSPPLGAAILHQHQKGVEGIEDQPPGPHLLDQTAKPGEQRMKVEIAGQHAVNRRPRADQTEPLIVRRPCPAKPGCLREQIRRILFETDEHTGLAIARASR